MQINSVFPKAAAVFILAMGLLWALPPGATAEDEIIGSLRNVEGDAFVIRRGQTLPAQAKQQLAQKDVLRTGADGSLGAILRDDTVLSLGPDSEIALEEFQFAPVEDRLGLVTRMVRGTASFLTGQIGKMRPAAVKVETPSATIFSRGTHFLVQVPGE